MVIKVTEDHIKRGLRGVGGWCAVAMALKDMGYPHPAVDRKDLALSEGGRFLSLPKEAQEFIWKFDAGRPVEPIEFEVADK